jgi:hypothetical protein
MPDAPDETRRGTLTGFGSLGPPRLKGIYRSPCVRVRNRSTARERDKRKDWFLVT